MNAMPERWWFWPWEGGRRARRRRPGSAEGSRRSVHHRARWPSPLRRVRTRTRDGRCHAQEAPRQARERQARHQARPV